MATYFVASGGSNTSPYDTWAKAATSLATALAAASTVGDIVVLQKDAIPSGDTELSVDTTYTFAANNVQLISATNDGGSAYTPSAMGTTYWIGNSTTNRSITIAGGVAAFIYGVTLRVSGSTSDSITLANTPGGRIEYEDCYFWQGNTSSASNIYFSQTRATVRTKNCTFRFGQSGQGIYWGAFAEIVGGSVSSAGTAPLTLFRPNALTGAQELFARGVDLSVITGTLVADSLSSVAPICCHIDRCKLGAGVVPLAAQSAYHGTNVLVTDCHSGDTHGIFGYYDSLGQAATNTSVYFTSSAAGQSWKIDTTAKASPSCPFRVPAFGVYHDGTSAITPYMEILRDGSATAYQNDEVWLLVSAKTTTTSTISTDYSDRVALSGAPADQAAGAGLGSWTGEGGTAWSGKIDAGSSLTPAEAGMLSAQICVGEPSITVYVDPYIRT